MKALNSLTDRLLKIPPISGVGLFLVVKRSVSLFVSITVFIVTTATNTATTLNSTTAIRTTTMVSDLADITV